LLQEGAVSDDNVIHDVSTAVLFRHQNDVAAPVTDGAPAATDQQPAIDGPEEALDRSEASVQPAAAYETVTGPFSKDEFATLIDQSSRGASASEIAQSLGRNAKSVQNKITRSRDQIQQASDKRRASYKKYVAKPKAKEPVRTDSIAELTISATWTPKLDLKLAQLMAKGTGAAGAAAVLRLQKEHVHARWREIKDWVGEPIQSNDDIVAALQDRLTTLDHTSST